MVWWIVIGVVLVGAMQLWVLWAQKRMSFWPNPDRQSLAGVVAAGFREIELTSGDGVKLIAWWRPPDEGRAVILYFGGNAGTIADRSLFLLTLAGNGYGILGVNYRGYGGSEGSPSEKGIYLDGLAGYEFLHHELAGKTESVVVYGQSLGGTVATYVAHHKPVAGIILEASFTRAEAMARRVIPYLPLWLLMTYRFDNLGRIQTITCPKLIVQGQQDETIPLAHGQQLFAAASEPKRCYFIPGAFHNDVVEKGGAAYREVLEGFIDSCTALEFPPPPEAGSI